VPAPKHDQLSFRESGRGEPLLLINGYAAGKLDWDPRFIDALAVRSRVICPDNRGIGESPPGPDVIDVSTMADDVISLMDVLSWRGPTWPDGQWAASSPRSSRLGRRSASGGSCCSQPTPGGRTR
jgi:pimeloyl-ACP methyl ester carboxylesterase